MLTLSAFGLLGSSIAATAQNASSWTIAPSATGKVVGPDSKPQAGVPVEVTGPEGSTTAFTDQNGQWSLYNLKPGDYSVKPVAPMAPDQKMSTDFKIQAKGWFDTPKLTYDAGALKLDKPWQPY